MYYPNKPKTGRRLTYHLHYSSKRYEITMFFWFHVTASTRSFTNRRPLDYFSSWPENVKNPIIQIFSVLLLWLLYPEVFCIVLQPGESKVISSKRNPLLPWTQLYMYICTVRTVMNEHWNNNTISLYFILFYMYTCVCVRFVAHVYVYIICMCVTHVVHISNQF